MAQGLPCRASSLKFVRGFNFACDLGFHVRPHFGGPHVTSRKHLKAFSVLSLSADARMRYHTFDGTQALENERWSGRCRRKATCVLIGSAGLVLWSAAIAGGFTTNGPSGGSLENLGAKPLDQTAAWLNSNSGRDAISYINVSVTQWSAGDAEPEVRLEEHMIIAPCFSQQTYAYWRYGLNGPQAARGRRRLTVTSYAYHSKRELIAALWAKRVAAGALVFADVRYTALDYEWDYDLLTRPPYNLSRSSLVEVGDRQRLPGLDERYMDPTCVYDYTPDLLLRSRLLRTLLSYESPLTLVVSGDVACRLRLPQTHHKVIISNDAAGAQCETLDASTRVEWWPQGLEGLASYGPAGKQAEQDALAITDADWIEPADRPFVLNDAISVNWRKPSRLALVAALQAGAGDALENLAAASGRGLRLEAKVVNGPVIALDVPAKTPLPDPAAYNGNSWRAAVAGSLFAICPAGDVYSTGRVVSAMALGAIPVIDATYSSGDHASAKGCDDPARFWRDGSPEFPHGAPFVFVDNWTQLPRALEPLITDPGEYSRRLIEMSSYRKALEAHLRSIAFDQPTHNVRTSACREIPLDGAEKTNLLNAAKDYYTQGHTPTSWFDQHVDSPATPGATCGSQFETEMTGVDMGALCFEAACAPPQVRNLDCFFADNDMVMSTHFQQTSDNATNLMPLV